ncbi:MAG: isoprenyl transferase [Candidatus Aminicenantes bacterium]|nr:isoprenyl transferase [Candidatus Aminicenantes bacterium]
MRESLIGYIRPGGEEEALVRRIDFSRLPRHIAVIMDGNGRWARSRNLPRIEGHRAGSKAVREVVEAAARLGIQVLSLYAFSRENWKRPRAEVSRLWRLLREFLKREDKNLMKNAVRLRVIGRREDIPEAVVREFERVEALTRTNKRLTVALALNYGGRTEIVDAARRLLTAGSVLPAELDEERFARYLYTDGLPDPDLLIRTSGEMRISNFLLWQIAYAEIWITPVFWPDFRCLHLLQAILDFQGRERRFGDIQDPETSA